MKRKAGLCCWRGESFLFPSSTHPPGFVPQNDHDAKNYNGQGQDGLDDSPDCLEEIIDAGGETNGVNESPEKEEYYECCDDGSQEPSVIGKEPVPKFCHVCIGLLYYIIYK